MTEHRLNMEDFLRKVRGSSRHDPDSWIGVRTGIEDKLAAERVLTASVNSMTNARRISREEFGPSARLSSRNFVDMVRNGRGIPTVDAGMHMTSTMQSMHTYNNASMAGSVDSGSNHTPVRPSTVGSQGADRVVQTPAIRVEGLKSIHDRVFNKQNIDYNGSRAFTGPPAASRPVSLVCSPDSLNASEADYHQS